MTSDSDGRTLAEGWGALVGYDYVADKSTPIAEPIAAALRASGGEAEPEL
jgi:acyl-CoA thioester hydrolase